MTVVITRLGRTEIQVAADTVWAVWRTGLIEKKSKNLVTIAKAAGVTMEDVLAAQERATEGRTEEPELIRVTSTPVPGGVKCARPGCAMVFDPCTTYDGRPNIRKRRSYCTKSCQWQHRTPKRRPGELRSRELPLPTGDPNEKRRCNRCKKTKPIGEFLPRADRDYEQRRGECNECRQAYQADRYCRVGAKVVTIELWRGDPAVGAPCGYCGEKFEIGDRVCAEHLQHERCADEVAERLEFAG